MKEISHTVYSGPVLFGSPCIVTKASRIARHRVRFCLLHPVYERTSRFIDTWLGKAVGKIDSTLHIFVFMVGSLKWAWISTNNLGAYFGLDYSKFNTRPAGGGRICPSWFFQNKSKTVADIDNKFGVPYPTAIWHSMTKFSVEIGPIFFILTFLWGYFTPILTKIGSMLRSSPKIEF